MTRVTPRLRPGRSGWWTTAGVTAVAAALRLPALGRPGTLVFDETYYVKDAWTLLNLGYEAQWPAEADDAFEAGDVDGYRTEASYVVHPPLGKWVIAAGLRLLGGDDPVGWRIGVAVAGVLTVLLVTRAARRLLGSTALGAVAGLVVALDGSAIVHSRTALLDGVLTLWVVAAFAALLVDRDHARRRLASRTGPPRAPTDLGPGLGPRPWRILAGVMLGLAVATKWSALWYLAVFGLMTVAWDASARYRAGVRRWWLGALWRDAPPAAASLVLVAAATYVASWASWFASPDAYGRQATTPGMAGALGSWWSYHLDMWRFHTGLEAEHPYTAHPAGWLLQLRPTSFFFASPDATENLCGADRCAQAVTSLGNPFVWWFGVAALVMAVWWTVRRRDGVAATVLAGVAAGWLPWFAYAHRPVFTFYAVVLVPWLGFALAWAVGRLLAGSAHDPARRRVVVTALAVAAVLVVGSAVFFWPVWTAELITFRQWQLRQWLPSWV